MVSLGAAPITVLLVEDHDVVRAALTTHLQQAPDLSVIGAAATARDALVMITRLRPDVVVVDLRLPDGNGIDVCRVVRDRDPGVRCVVLTAHATAEEARDTLAAGAAGIVLMTLRAPLLVETIRDVVAGQTIVSVGILG